MRAQIEYLVCNDVLRFDKGKKKCTCSNVKLAVDKLGYYTIHVEKPTSIEYEIVEDFTDAT